MAIITAEQFRNKAVSIISIPGFDKDETFEIKVKKLSLVGLMSSGKIPNSLMSVVKDAFAGIKSGASSEDNDAAMMDKAGEIGKLLDIVCAEAMVEPRFDDIRDVMNDAQKMEIFAFTQGGVEQAKNFPAIEGDTRHTDDVEDVSSQTE